MSDAPATVGSLRRALASRLCATSPTASLDARVLVAHVVGCEPSQIALRDDEVPPPVAVARLYAMAERRAAGEPVERIVGVKEFFGLPLRLSAETLIPRPDTETLVEVALASVAARDAQNAPLRILDLGTGTGAILLALLANLPNATGTGVDRADGALATARENARALSLEGRAAFVSGNWLEGLTGPFDLVVSNPPYIPRVDISGLQVEVRVHDPYLALDGGEDGLDAVRAILAGLASVLDRDGAAFVEIGIGQAEAVTALAIRHGFTCQFTADLGGIPRVAALKRAA